MITTQCKHGTFFTWGGVERSIKVTIPYGQSAEEALLDMLEFITQFEERYKIHFDTQFTGWDAVNWAIVQQTAPMDLEMGEPEE